jgi:putative flippase GtrA
MNINKQLIIKVLKFGAVGFSGLMIDYGTTFFCKEVLEINKYTANGLGFVLAASSNFLLNRKWTFQSDNPNILKEYAIFFTVATVGLLLNTSIIWLLDDYLSIFNFYVSKFLAILLVFAWNFLLNNFYNFKQAQCK